MAGLKHAFVSGVTDDAGHPEWVRPSNWNAQHLFDSGAAGSLAFRGAGDALDGSADLTWSGTRLIDTGELRVGGVSTYFSPTNYLNSLIGIDAATDYVTILGAEKSTATGMNGVYVYAIAKHAAGTSPNVVAMNLDAANTGAGDADVVNGAYFTAVNTGAGTSAHLWAIETYAATFAGAATEAIGLKVDSNTGTIGTNIGIDIENQTAGSIANYAIRTGSGLISFNGSRLSLAGNFTTSGAFASTFTMTGATGVTFPTSGTLATTTDLGSYLPLTGGTLTPAVGATALTIAGVTQTASFPVISASQTWNNGAVTFVGQRFSVTSTASVGSSGGVIGSLVFDYQVGGATKLALTRGGLLTFSSSATDAAIRVNGTSLDSIKADGSAYTGFTGSYLILNTAAFATATLGIEAADTFQFGVDVNGAASAYTLKGPDGITGTDRAGGSVTHASGRGTGAGAVSSLIFQTPTVLSTGTTAQSLATRLTLDSANATFAVPVKLSNAAVTGLVAGVLAASTNASIVLVDSTGQAYRIPCVI